MEKIIAAIETIEANSARMFGLEDEKTQLVFMLTDSLRAVFENKEAVENVSEASPATEHGVVCFKDLVEMNDEEAKKAIATLSAEETEALIREGMCRLLEECW